MKVTILGAGFDTGNMGVSVLAAGAVRNVSDRYPNAEILFLDYGRAPAEWTVWIDGSRPPIRTRMVNARFSKWLLQPNNILLLVLLALLARCCPWASGRQWIRTRNRTLAAVSTSNLCLSVAGGDSFSDIYGFMRLLYVGLPQVLAILCECRLVLLPQTMGPFRGKSAQRLAAWILRRAELIYTRDLAGLDEVRRLSGLDGQEAETRIRFCHDMGFHVEPRKPAAGVAVNGLPLEALGQPGLVGLNISGLLLDGGERFGFSMSYKEVVELLLDKLLGQGLRVLLVPHVISKGVDNDLAACQWAYDKYRERYPGQIGVVAHKYCYDETKYLIGQCDFFVGARMHACIGALSQSVPVAAIAYSNKFEGVMQSIGRDGITVDLRKGTAGEAVQRVLDLYANREESRRKLSEVMPGVKQNIGRMLEPVELAGV